jgi:thymidine phosphorylase
VEDPSRLPQAAESELYSAPSDGVVAAVEPRAIGFGLIELGGGRRLVTDQLDPSDGFVMAVRPGDVVHVGEPLASILARDAAGLEIGRRTLDAAITLGDEADYPLPLVSHRVTVDGTDLWEPAESTEQVGT